MWSTKVMQIPSRRNFLTLGARSLTAIGAASLAGRLSQVSALAQSACPSGADYKALVCVFLFGGNDGNNTLIPIDTAGYASYVAVRGPLALPQAGLIPLQETSGSARYGLHPSLSSWQSLWESGQLALLLNVGTLTQPLTKANFSSSATTKPTGLFSHADQQAH